MICKLRTFWIIRNLTQQLQMIQPHHAAFSTVPLPPYNHGLSGKGKRGRQVKNLKISLPVDIKGEILFGIHPILLALQSKQRNHFHSLYVYDKFDSNLPPNLEKILRISSQMGLVIKSVNKHLLNKLSGNRPHQGVCLDVSKLTCSSWKPYKAVSWSPLPIWLFLQHVKDPMNFGAILRTSYFLGVDRVIVPHNNSCKLSPVVSKASSGALEVIHLQKLSESFNEIDLCQWWIESGGEIVGADSTQNDGGQNLIPLNSFRLSKPTLLIVGNEGEGLSNEIDSLCQTKIHIPSLLPPFKQEIGSLNVSVATGILLHWLQMSRSS